MYMYVVRASKAIENSQWPSPNLGKESEEHDQNCQQTSDKIFC